MSKLTVNLNNETGVSVDVRPIEETLKLILRRLDRLDRVDMELLIVGDSKIKELNNKYRNINKATDVLGFPSPDTAIEDKSFIGSVVISLDTAKEQAKQAGVRLDTELRTLAGHGFLHLLGFHHQ